MSKQCKKTTFVIRFDVSVAVTGDHLVINKNLNLKI